MFEQKYPYYPSNPYRTKIMGKVTFKGNQPTQSLSGTLGGVTYRMDAEGQTFAFIRSHSSVPVIDEYLRYKDHPQLIDNPDELRKAILLAYRQRRKR